MLKRWRKCVCGRLNKKCIKKGRTIILPEAQGGSYAPRRCRPCFQGVWKAAPAAAAVSGRVPWVMEMLKRFFLCHSTGSMSLFTIRQEPISHCETRPCVQRWSRTLCDNNVKKRARPAGHGRLLLMRLQVLAGAQHGAEEKSFCGGRRQSHMFAPYQYWLIPVHALHGDDGGLHSFWVNHRTHNSAGCRHRHHTASATISF